MGTWGAWYPADGDVIETEPILGGPMVDFAEASLTQILDTLPDHRSTPAQLSDEEMRQLTALGYVGGAGIEVSAQVDPRDVMHVIPLTWQVERLLTRNDTEQANHLLQQLEKHLGKSHGVRHLRARLLRAEGRPFAAIAVLETLFQEAPSTDRALLLGRLNADIADWREAEFWFGESLALHPANAKAMSGLVRSARNQGAIGVARQRAERFLAMYPDHLDLLMIRGELLLMDRRFDEALEVAQLSVTLAPHHAGVQAQWGQALWNLGRSDEAIDAFWESLAIDPNHLGNRLQYIDALLDMERNAEAMRALRQVADHLAGVPALESRLNRCQLALERTP
jgi:tetratricopeptide (TPR) repeat protein